MLKRIFKINDRRIDKIGIKDSSVRFIKERFPEIMPHIEDVLIIADQNKTREFRFITIDVFSKVYFKDEKTCVDPGWHVDGKDSDNEYFIVCFGSNRTIFQELGEVDDGVIYHYGSKDIHKGRVCEAPGYRLMIRVCFSDYIGPKNKIFY